MSKSYRVRTQVGVDKSVTVNLEQDFDFLEILSLKLTQSEIYIRQCSDYGVIAGRVSVNDGYGIPNAKLSLFIPITAADELNPTISEIYPYKTITDINEDGYRYNLLPYKPSFPGHSPTGSFPDLEDVLTNPTAIELYDKYYKFTVTTNDSGDFMMFGVPVGSYTIVMNLDLSDMGPFSQSPQDLIRIGLATDSQVNGTKFQTSENLSTLPQIIFLNKTVEVLPLWGEPEICQPSITRADFDLTAEANITIKPTAIFLGSIFSDVDKGALKRNCKPKLKSGQMCSLVSGPGQILAVRQTIKQDIDGRPILEEYELENNGNVIDYDGTWLLDTPMNMDYIITNEFGEQIFSNDERKGVPTKAKYRFKIRWTQPPDLSASVKRGTFLVPNVKEHGWSSSNSDPINVPNINYQLLKASYAFSKNWADYGVIGDTDGEIMIQDAIDCKDMFYEMTYNKVYTISQLITRYTKGTLNRRYLGIKNITAEECDNSSNKLPTNDAQYRPDLLFIAFTILLGFLSIIIKIIVKIFHIICALAYAILNFQICLPFRIGCRRPFENNSVLRKIIERFSTINLPLYSYPDCEICSCAVPASPGQQSGSVLAQSPFVNSSILADFIDTGNYETNNVDERNDFTLPFQQMAAGFQGTNPDISFTYRTPNISAFKYDNGGDTDNIKTLGIYTTSLPLHEKVTLMNFKGKFFGNGNMDSNQNSPLNVAPSGSGFGVGNMIGGGTSQIKTCFNYELNSPNLNWDQQNNNNLNLNLTTNGFHYDNVLILAIEEKFNAGTILTFNNPYSFNDPNLSASTLNSYGATSITGTPINISTAFTDTVNVSHTNPYTGERLLTAYRLNQTSGDTDNYLRYPTDIEYFQVITAMTSNEMNSVINYGGAGSFKPSFIRRALFTYTNVSWFSLNDGGGVSQFGGIDPWGAYNQKESTYFTILVRGVDPHSTRQPVQYGLGRLFAYQNHWDVIIKGNYKLNIPLQPNDELDFGDGPTSYNNNIAKSNAQRCTKHNLIDGNDNSGFDSGYSKGRIFFKSFHFKPSPTDWTPFTTRSVYKYSSLSEADYVLTTNDTLSQVTSAMNAYTFIAGAPNGGGLRVRYTNWYTHGNGVNVFNNAPYPTQFDYGNYVPGESVEGGSIMTMVGGTWNLWAQAVYADLYFRLFSTYYSKKYDEPILDSNCFEMIDSERIVMRTDRMPTSDKFQIFNPPGYPPMSMTMMANGQFYISEVSDDGIVTANVTVSPTFVVNEPEIIPYDPTEPEIPNKIAALLDSFTCNSLVPIECYSPGPNDTVNIAPSGQCQFYSSEGFTTQFFVAGSCYSLVRQPFNQKNNVNNDIELVNEWYSRMNINFGACREVFAHGFFNSWINGTLYAFPFRNARSFTGPNDNPPNQPYNKVCKTNIFLHPDTFNFYYRSAPYKDSNGTFIGREGDETVGGNKKNHMYPTTIMDLGPRDELQKFLSQSGNWDGYIMNKLDSTTFGDTSDLLNIFVISRLANTSFTTFFKSRTSSVLNFFDSRKRKFVDGDFAQMIATNSQFGIASYEPESYPEPTGTTFNSSLFLPTFFDKTKDIVFGIFFTGDSQSRDYISPNRTIYNPNGRIGADDACAFSYIPLKTQVVPFYLWDIKNNQSVSNIFGNQENNWSSDIFSYEYQKIDRLYSASRNFQPDPNINIINYHKGWIYNVDDYSTISNPINDATGEFDYKPKDGLPGSYLLGAPFYFYFGLTKGASAFDRFTAKWIDTDGFA
jgi:hypothetical protein